MDTIHANIYDDFFIHFTYEDRAKKIIEHGILLVDPPYPKFGIDGVQAISVKYGNYVPEVQVTHLAMPEHKVVAILFKTNTKPSYGYPEEVIWNSDVKLLDAKIISKEEAIHMLKPAGHEDYRIVYESLITHLIETYYTKHGQKIELKYVDNFELDNRGWRYDRIDAFVGGHHAGYLKIAYMPKKNFESHYPNIFAYIQKIEGQHLTPTSVNFDSVSSGEGFLYQNYSNAERKEFLKNILFRFHLVSYSTADETIDKLSDDQVLKEIKKAEKLLKTDKKFGKNFKQFQAYHVDKPEPDFIRVFNSFDTRGRGNYQRQRIAETLYIAAAKWMKQRGLYFYASTTQTDDARNIWKFLKNKYHVEYDNSSGQSRPYLIV